MNSLRSKLSELYRLEESVSSAVAMAAELNDENTWGLAFDQVFSAQVSTRVYALFHELTISFDYYDPDTSYREDVEAFANALKSKVDDLKRLNPDIDELDSNVDSQEILQWLDGEVFAVQHDPMDLVPYVVRLTRNGSDILDLKPFNVPENERTKDVMGFGATLAEAAENARKRKVGS